MIILFNVTANNILNTAGLAKIVLFDTLFNTITLFPWSLFFEAFSNGKYLIILKECHEVS